MSKKSKKQLLASQRTFDQSNQNNETGGFNSSTTNTNNNNNNINDQSMSENESLNCLNDSSQCGKKEANQVNDASSIESIADEVKALEDDDEDDEIPEEIALLNVVGAGAAPLDMRKSSSFFVNSKSMNDVTGNRIADQFHLYRPDRASGPAYYDYCYGQQLASDNLF